MMVVREKKYKKILLITSKADAGGGSKRLYLLAKGLLDYLDSVYIASPDEKPFGPLYKEIAYEHLEIPKRRFSLIALIKLYVMCKQNQISLVHSHGLGGSLYSKPLSLFGIKAVHTFYGIHLTKDFIGKIKLILNKINVAHKIICVSEDEKQMAQEILSLNPSKVTVIYNAPNLHPMLQAKNQCKFDLKKLLFKQNLKGKLVFGTLCRLNYQKGLDILLNLICHYKAQDNSPPFVVYIAGEGKERKNLAGMIKKLDLEDTCFFIGNIDKPYSFLRSLDLFISTSRYEAMPYSVLEAIALNTPILLSDVTGHRVFGKDNLFNLDDPKSFERTLNNKLKSLETEPKKNNRLLEKCSLDKMIKETVNVYNSL